MLVVFKIILCSYLYRYINTKIFPSRYQSSDGKSASEEGVLKNIGSENEALEVRGSFSYLGDDGVVYTVNYIANENGYQPQGAHLPSAQ